MIEKIEIDENAERYYKYYGKTDMLLLFKKMNEIIEIVNKTDKMCSGNFKFIVKALAEYEIIKRKND